MTARLPGPLLPWSAFSPEASGVVMTFQLFRDHPPSANESPRRTVYQAHTFKRPRAFARMLNRLKGDNLHVEEPYGYLALLHENREVVSVLPVSRLSFQAVTVTYNLMVSAPAWKPVAVSLSPSPLLRTPAALPQDHQLLRLKAKGVSPHRKAERLTLYDEPVQLQGGAEAVANLLAALPESSGDEISIDVLNNGGEVVLVQAVPREVVKWWRECFGTRQLTPPYPKGKA